MNNDIFCNFVLRYCSERERAVFENVCPVTLYYHYSIDIPLSLYPGQIYTWDDPIITKEAHRMLAAISDSERRESAQKKHSYVKLLYKLRSKLVHELNNIGTAIEFSSQNPTISSKKDGDGHIVWTFNYPRDWLYNLAYEIINNYIADCITNEASLRFIDTGQVTHLNWYSK